MKKLLSALTLAGLALMGPTQVHAQTADSKLEWATKVVNLQQGPELERLTAQLADSASQELIAAWAPRLQGMPKDKQTKATEELNAALGKYTADVKKIIAGKVSKVSAETLIPAYVERFSQEELKQLAQFFESPAVKKYQSIAPELGGLFVGKLIEASKPEVISKAQQFENSASQIVGTAPATTPSQPDKKK